jgi:hypothetical protein
MSFDDNYRHLGLGNACQFHQIQSLANGDTDITHYDLGTGLAYKERWAEVTQSLEVLLVRNLRA